MLGSPALDVAIGLMFVYLVLSLMCTTCNEFIMSVLRWRSKALVGGLREILSSDLIDRFYQHPLISSLYRGEYNPKKSGNLPAYIPSAAFAHALLDLVAHELAPNTGQTSTAGQSNGQTQGTQTGQGGGQAQSAPSGGQAQNVQLSDNTPDTLAVVRYFYDLAGQDLEKTRKDLELWFDACMDRVSGWYKRRAQFASLLIALFLTLGLNVDTLAIVDWLSTEKAAREALVAQSTVLLAQSDKILGDAAKKLQAADNPNQTTEEAKDISAAMRNSLQQLQGLHNTLVTSPLPLGWGQQEPPKLSPLGQHYWPNKILGILLTTVALSLGAPFWFDILGTVIRLSKQIPSISATKPETPAKP